MEYRILGKRILVQEYVKKTTTGGIELLKEGTSRNDDYSMGVVLGVGEDIPKDFIREGDEVFFLKTAGTVLSINRDIRAKVLLDENIALILSSKKTAGKGEKNNEIR